MKQIQLNRLLCAIGMVAVAMASQVSYANEQQASAQMQMPSVGHKLDKNGCNPATGASWCAKEKACVQPWVLSAQKGFQKGNKAAFDAYCQAPAPAPAPMTAPMVGSQRDAHGCIPSAGYSWCAKDNACVQPWVLSAQKGFPKGNKAAFDAYCQANAK
jgi:hypothetical protein